MIIDFRRIWRPECIGLSSESIFILDKAHAMFNLWASWIDASLFAAEARALSRSA
jgi:hypothetical protein